MVDVKAFDVGVLRDPRNMVKAGLPKAQSPDDASRHPPERRLNRCRALRRCCGFAELTSGVRAMPTEGIQGDELAAYVPLDTYDQDERGIAYGTRVLWRRRSGSSRRSHDLPRRAGEPSTGRSRPGDRGITIRKVGEMPNAEPGRDAQRGRGRWPVRRDGRWRARRPDGTAGSGRGPLEKDPKGYLASLAARSARGSCSWRPASPLCRLCLFGRSRVRVCG